MQILIKHVRLKIDWLMLMFPIIATALGEGQTAMMLLASLSIHETAHLLAARALHIPIQSLRLTPFGSMAQIGNPYTLTAAQLCAVSAAGPLGSLMGMLLTSALCYWHAIPAEIAAELIPINAVLMMFNLLPALPLDGGRILFALLSLHFSREQALKVGIILGRVLAISLIFLAISGLTCQGQLNLSLLLTSLFILTSARDERRALTDTHIHTLIDCLQPIGNPLPVNLVAIDAHTPPESALHAAVPGKITLFARFLDGCLSDFIDDRTLLRQMLDKTPNAHEKK